MIKMLTVLLMLALFYIIIGMGFGLAATWFAGERVTLRELLLFSLLWPNFFIGR
jgi:hypothetical protein